MPSDRHPEPRLSVASALPYQVHSMLNAHNNDVTVAGQMHKYWFKEYMA